MDARDLIRAGKLTEARQTLIEGIKRSPAEAALRTLLFQVLVLLGEWDKARKHAAVIAEQSVSAEIGVQVYINLIAAEEERLEVAEGKRRPSFLPKTPPYAEIYFSALAALEDGDIETAAAHFSEVGDMRPDVAGTRSGESFEAFFDMDSRLSSFLEAFVHERYVWIPVEAIRELVVDGPQSLFDTIWATGRVTAWDGLTLNCFFPVIYPGSFRQADDRIKMGRMTDWRSMGGGFYQGLGQRIFQVGGAEVPILDLGEALFSDPAAPAAMDEGEHDD